jgi:ubiquinone/menaquinone biosynthesis C-methylase UbiE
MSEFHILKETFTNIYEEEKWAMGQTESKSGLGSTLNFALCISDSLLEVLQEYSIQKMVDTSCGDWNWMRRIQKDLCTYIGIDIVESVIDKNQKKYGDSKTSFICKDFLSFLKVQPDNSIDLVFCRHTCEHLPKDYIFDFFFECKRVAKFLLLTTKKTSPEEPCNQELLFPSNTYRPINLDLPPFEAFFKPYFVKEIYDGPVTTYDPQMYIYLYKFN